MLTLAGVMLAVTAPGWLGFALYEFARRTRAGASNPATLGRMEERLARIEAAVETVALEVERLGEAQRFNARLLAEQRAPLVPAAARGARMDRRAGDPAGGATGGATAPSTGPSMTTPH